MIFFVEIFLLEVCASLLSHPNFDSLLFDDMLDSHLSLRKPRLQGEVSDKIGRLVVCLITLGVVRNIG